MTRLRVSERTYGLILVLFWLMFLVHRPVMQWADDLMTVQPWFSVSFNVPDFEAGTEPIVDYDRTVNRTVYGVWSAKILRHNADGSDNYICGGDGYARYDPETAGTIRMPLGSFVGDTCKLPPANYRACVSYELTDHRGVARSFGPFCSAFTVTPAIDDKGPRHALHAS